jgi:uncharacterized phage protein (TIGR01671 family)
VREIEFRGKRIEAEYQKEGIGEWIYGVYFGFNSMNSEAPLILPHDEVIADYVDRDTVGQYTGLEDKNGVKIFEGDIVLFDYENLYKNLKGVVSLNEYFHSCLKAITPDWKVEEFHIEQAINGKIIGNVHDHPELLGRE